MPSADQPSVAGTGWASGQGEVAAAPTVSPNSERQAAAAQLIGFQSATVRSQPGIPAVGT